MAASIFFWSILFWICSHNRRKNRVHAPYYVKSAALIPLAWNPFTVNHTWHWPDVTRMWPDVPASHSSMSTAAAGAAQGKEPWDSIWKPWPGSVSGVGKSDWGPVKSLFSSFWEWAIGFSVPWGLPYLEGPHVLAAGSGWLRCVYWLSSEAQAATELPSNSREK